MINNKTVKLITDTVSVLFFRLYYGKVCVTQTDIFINVYNI